MSDNTNVAEQLVGEGTESETLAVAESLSVEDFEAIFTDGEHRMFTNEIATID